ncbi:hypothetical protein Pfo_008302 [Paulownia fortunei]|nr:hypothetical protein Pfo_008302 [Paulownia fortunei]
MGITASSSTKSLPEIRQQIIKWRSRPNLIDDEAEIPWTEPHLSAILDYVLKLEGINSSHLIAQSPDQVRHRRCGPHKSRKFAEMVVSFTQDLRELFKVPKPQQLSDEDETLKKNELVAAFINFLLQLLHHRTGSIDSFEDRIDSLKKELRFLVNILGDTALIGAELEQVLNLFKEFEAVANDAGSLVHSFIFTTDRLFNSIRIDKALDALLVDIDRLRANIIKVSNLLPLNSKANITPTTAAVDSLFSVDSLLYDLEDLLNRDDSLIVDVKDQIKIMHQELMLSQSFIKSVKEPPHSEMEKLKEPVIRIREVAYEAEYLINSFLVGDAPLWYFSIRLPQVIHKIKLIGTELLEIKTKYDIGALKVAKDFSAQLSFQAKRNSIVDDITVGFEDKATHILDQLLGGREHLQFISIFGMPGLGKTTLAKKLYNHPSVSYRFDKSSWFVVSQTYHMKTLLAGILISLASELDKVKILVMEEESLVEHIYKSLKGRRYLIVMDDIWSSNVWHDFRRCLPDDGNGSRILFTSRNKDVAPPNSIIYALPSLSNDQCWELLEKKVFHDEPCPPQLLGIGMRIAANCCGLPLAVVVIAGILSTLDKKKSTWEKVGGNLASYIYDGGDNSMMRILEISYKNLADHLKPCFLYFGVFPEDTEIPAGKLMRLWISEGFIRREENKSSESVAEECLMELIDKSLVMVAKRRSDGGVKACVIHDLLRDLCLKISEEENFVKLDNNYSIYEKGHRLLSLQNSLPPFGHHVRSFQGYLLCSSFYVLNMKLLRVLDLRTIFYPAHLIEFEFLVHLRYLAITYMPPSIGSLVNLEFLLVKTKDPVYISSVILKMVKLRYLQVSLAIFGKDCNSSQTNNLEFISNVRIYKLKDEEMLKCSPHLRKLKCICEPLSVEEKGAYQYRYPNLRFLTQLESLKMTNFNEDKMAEINFPSNIKKLTLDGLGLPREKMSIIGRLPKLEVLKLGSETIVGETWETRDGEFQQLRFLKLEGSNLAQWNVAYSEHFPKLQRLILHHCYKLQEIPCEIGESATLQLIEVQGRCPKSLVESAIQIQQEQLDMGNEELRIIITDTFDDDNEDIINGSS